MWMRELEAAAGFWNWGMFMFRFRWIIVGVWIVIFSFSITYAEKLPNLLTNNGFTPTGSESDIGLTKMQKQLDLAPSELSLVYTSKTLDLTKASQIKTIKSSLTNIKKLPYVKAIKLNNASRLNHRKDVQSFIVELNLTNNEALDQFPKIRRMIQVPAHMSLYADGSTATLYDTQKATKKDLSKSETIGLPIALIVLVLIFGTIFAAILPIIMGLMSVTVTLAITSFIANYLSLSNFMPNMVSMIGLAVGIDYALFIVSRFREELNHKTSVCEAIARTSLKAGKSIFFSGFAVLIGLFGMLFINLPVMRSFCIGGVIVVLVSVILSNTLLLAFLSILGHKINFFSLVPAIKKRQDDSTAWKWIALTVMKHPLGLSIFMSGVLILLMIPIGHMKLGVPTADVLPPSFESRTGSDLLKQTFDQREANPIQIYIEAPHDIQDERTIKEIQSFSKRVSDTPGVKEVKSYLKFLGNPPASQAVALVGTKKVQRELKNKGLASGNAALLIVIPNSMPESAKTADLVERLRAMHKNSLHTWVTGMSATRVDILKRINRGFPLLFIFVLSVTYIVLFFAFRSIFLPLKAVVMNILSLGSSLGIVVSVFQRGWMAHPLHITSVGYVNIILPVTIFCVVFGISMDYEVFLISRIKEEYEKTKDNERSTAEGLEKTGGLITSAAFILMAVVGSFIFTNIEITKGLGIGLFSAVFIDATFIRVILVPALMKLLGPVNWWIPTFRTSRVPPS